MREWKIGIYSASIFLKKAENTLVFHVVDSDDIKDGCWKYRCAKGR